MLFPLTTIQSEIYCPYSKTHPLIYFTTIIIVRSFLSLPQVWPSPSVVIVKGVSALSFSSWLRVQSHNADSIPATCSTHTYMYMVFETTKSVLFIEVSNFGVCCRHHPIHTLFRKVYVYRMYHVVDYHCICADCISSCYLDGTTRRWVVHTHTKQLSLVLRQQ